MRVGESARFFPETAGRQVTPLHVTGIDRDATRTLTEPLLALGHGGEIAVREKRGQLVPEQAIYRVTLAAEASDGAAQSQHLRGHVVIDGAAKSMLGDLLRSAVAVVMREAGW